MSEINLRIIICGRYFGLMQILFVLTSLNVLLAANGENNNPGLEFSKHSIVHPTVHHGRTKREILSTKDTNGEHHPEVQVTMLVDNEPWVMQLKLNEDLVAENYIVIYQKGENTVKHMPKREELDLCHYSGNVQGKRQSWVALSTCHGLQGVMFDGQRMRYIEPARDTKMNSSHYLYDHKDLIKELRPHKPTTEPKSTNDPSRWPTVGKSVGEVFNIIDNTILSRNLLKKDIKKILPSKYSETNEMGIREPYNAKSSSRYVELVLVADHSMYKHFGGDMKAVHSYLIKLTNIVNSVYYVPLNIYIVLVGVVVWNKRDESPINQNSTETLKYFIKYRKNKLVLEIPHDNAHLLTRVKFSKQVLGEANVDAMCSSESGGVEVMSSDVIGMVAGTLAHEMGHNFGMNHDEDAGCKGGSKEYVMAETSKHLVPVTYWSTCSLESLKRFFEKKFDHCLHNKPKRLFPSPGVSTCGNGFVEPGEQCDCGVSIEGHTNPCHTCCDPNTCTLRSNATCGAGACCDFSTCRLKPAGVMCRSVDRECDLPEHCTGQSEYCPADIYKMDSTPCGLGYNQAFCVQGWCRSHSHQCQLLYGPMATSASQECYKKNLKGNNQGHCGVTKQHNTKNGAMEKCAEEDILCGLLQCQGINGKKLSHLQFTDIPTYIITLSLNERTFQCYTTNSDLGLVPDGAKCGHERMCLKQKCVSVKMVRDQTVKS